MGEVRLLDADRGARISPWQGRADSVHLVPTSDRPLRTDQVERILADLRTDGVAEVRTSALGPEETESFTVAGFTPAGRLALLSSPLLRSARPRAAWLRRGRSRDHDDLLAVDHRCFPEMWRFDPALLVDAIEATPTTRFRVGADPDPFAYAITGVAGSTAYLQRLAVDPARQRGGTGRFLVDDARQWAVRRGAATMLVNTAVDNTVALDFYQHLGFTRRATDLHILERRLDD